MREIGTACFLIINLISIFLIVIIISEKIRTFFRMSRVRNLIIIVLIWGFAILSKSLIAKESFSYLLFFTGSIFGLVIAIVGIYIINKKYLEQPINKFIYYLPFLFFLISVILAFLFHLPMKQGKLHFAVGTILISGIVYLTYSFYLEIKYKKPLYLNELKDIFKKKTKLDQP